MRAQPLRGAALFALALGAAGVVMGVPIAAVVHFGPRGLGGRVLVGAIVGALFGGTVGTILGGGLAMKSPDRSANAHPTLATS